MHDIQKREVKQLVNILNNVKAQYVIILPDGTKYMDALTPEPKPEPVKETKPKKKKKATGNRYAYGETAKYYVPFIKDLQPGASVEIPYDRFHGATLAQNIGSRCCRFWGPRAYTISNYKKFKVVAVLRR